MPARKRVRTRSVVAAVAGGGGAVIATKSSTVHMRDAMALSLLERSVKLTEKFTLDKLQLADTFKLTDKLNAFTLTVLQPDSFKPGELEQVWAAISNLVVGRSGTPDNDDIGDAWTDGVVANQGVNHGNEDLKVVNLIAGASIGWMKFNFGKWLSTSGTDTFKAKAGGTNTLIGSAAATAVATSPVLTFAFTAQAGNPFTESTLTFTNQPAPVADFSLTATIPGSLGVFADFTLTFTPAQIDTLRNKWVVCKITSADAINIVTIRSRDTATRRPTWVLDMERF